MLIGLALVCADQSQATSYHDRFAAGVGACLAVWMFGVNVVHMILTIMGTAKSNAGKVFANKIEIPFMRERPREAAAVSRAGHPCSPRKTEKESHRGLTNEKRSLAYPAHRPSGERPGRSQARSATGRPR